MRIEPIHFARWFESSSNWIAMRTWIYVFANFVLYMCEHGTKHAASAMAVGLTTEKTGDLVNFWGQANVQNELDAVARVVSSAQEVPFPSRLS